MKKIKKKDKVSSSQQMRVDLKFQTVKNVVSVGYFELATYTLPTITFSETGPVVNMFLKASTLSSMFFDCPVPAQKKNEFYKISDPNNSSTR